MMKSRKRPHDRNHRPPLSSRSPVKHYLPYLIIGSAVVLGLIMIRKVVLPSDPDPSVPAPVATQSRVRAQLPAW